MSLRYSEDGTAAGEVEVLNPAARDSFHCLYRNGLFTEGKCTTTISHVFATRIQGRPLHVRSKCKAKL